jgi:hypothetical protein
MDPNIENMRYLDLRKYCKSLGLKSFGKVSDLKSIICFESFIFSIPFREKKF